RNPAPPAASRSHSSVRRHEIAAEHHARLAATVVLPTPPFTLHTAITAMFADPSAACLREELLPPDDCWQLAMRRVKPWTCLATKKAAPRSAALRVFRLSGGLSRRNRRRSR